MTYYINMKDSGKVETVDQFDSLKEAKQMLKEYEVAFKRGLYISTRCTKDWKSK
jgi:hypothetical protein